MRNCMFQFRSHERHTAKSPEQSDVITNQKRSLHSAHADAPREM